MNAGTKQTLTSMIYEPRSWGLSSAAIKNLGNSLAAFWEEFADCFETATRDTNYYGLDYLSGLLRMTTERNFTNIGRTSGSAPQNVQHFMSNSPWNGEEVLRRIREQIATVPQFARGGVLILDESADKKSSEKTAGAGRQYNGRLGKIEMSQVGAFLAYANDGIWTWIDGELFLPEHWFKRSRSKERSRLGVPPERAFLTKIELGWRMIERVTAEGLLFELVCCDTLYGRNIWLRRKMSAAGLVYMADVPVNTKVYTEKPETAAGKTKRGKRNQAAQALEARELAAVDAGQWRRIEIRACERGVINDEFCACRVWTKAKGEEPMEEWLVMRREADGTIHYALSNAPADTTLERLAWGKCQRFFIEVTNREAKSEIGWDELRAQKYLAWEHHLALTCLASWFIAKTKLEWRTQHPRKAELAAELELDQLPPLSMANVRELLRAVMPLPQLTVERATELVVEHLVNRAWSRKSRLISMGKKHSLP